MVHLYYLAKREYDYAIRICAYLAGSSRDTYFTIKKLSDNLLISKPFATKIVFQLKKNKILNTTRGKNGGVSLAINPRKLTLSKIFKSVGMVTRVDACINDKGFCPLPAPCKIHKYFIDQEKEIINKLEKTTIDNFAFSDKNLKKNH